MKRLSLIIILLVLATTAWAADTEFTGFVDGAYFYNTADANGEFSLDQVEVDIIHRASDRTSLRADLEWIRDGEVFIAQVEQGFMTITFAEKWEVMFGKFNAPIGFELLDAPDMYQYSHAMVFDYGLPTNLTGAALSRDLGQGFDIIAHLSNGWDANMAAGKNVTFGGRLGYSSGGFGGGLSAISGKEEMQDDDDEVATPFKRTVFDVDLSYTTGRWLFGGEYNMGTITTDAVGGEVDQEWDGFLVMTNVSLSDLWACTLRYDTFNDKDGYAFGMVGDEAQKIQSFTISPSVALDENFGALIELRLDKSDQDGFVDGDGEATDTNTTMAFEMTYSF